MRYINVNNIHSNGLMDPRAGSTPTGIDATILVGGSGVGGANAGVGTSGTGSGSGTASDRDINVGKVVLGGGTLIGGTTGGLNQKNTAPDTAPWIDRYWWVIVGGAAVLGVASYAIVAAGRTSKR